ncbi:MAG: FHA domain-containing protein [Rhodomicrobium sp.]|nr:FHA domain-containing protein [Rhodomicrobium sp.]
MRAPCASRRKRPALPAALRRLIRRRPAIRAFCAPSLDKAQDPATAGQAPVGGQLAAGELALLQREGPVVGWLVVVSGPGKGLARPVYYGNNAIGRDSGQRIPLNFGDDAISSAEQAYIRYDSEDRRFLLMPNLAKSNLIAVNGGRPMEPVVLSRGDIIGMGQTQMMFVPLCGPEFDWADVEGQ